MMQHNNTANTHRSLCALAIVFTTKWGGCPLIRVCSLIRSHMVFICIVHTHGPPIPQLAAQCSVILSYGFFMPKNHLFQSRRNYCLSISQGENDHHRSLTGLNCRKCIPLSIIIRSVFPKDKKAYLQGNYIQSNLLIATTCLYLFDKFVSISNYSIQLSSLITAVNITITLLKPHSLTMSQHEEHFK